MTRAGWFLLVAGGAAVGPGAAAASSGAAQTVPLSVRQIGMGDVSAGDGDVLRGWTNPVWYFPGERRLEVGATGGLGFGGAQRTVGIGAGGLATPWLAIGGAMNRTGVRFDEVNAQGVTTGADITRGTAAYGLGAAMRSGWWRGGLTVKGVGDHVAGRSDRSLAWDVGTAVMLDRVMAAVVARNLGGRLYGIGLAREVRVTATYTVARWDATAGAEYTGVAERAGVVGLGVNWNLDRLFAVRGGVRFGPEQPAQVSAGASVAWRTLVIDYAAVTHPLGISHRAGLTARFGGLVDAASSIVGAP